MGHVWPLLAISIFVQGRIIHCAGCTMKEGAPSQGGPADKLPNFYHVVCMFERSVYA